MLNTNIYIYKLCFVVLNFWPVTKCRVMLPRAPTACWETVGDKRETSVESGGPENPKHTAGQSETSAGQVGDKCRTMQLRASTAYWETSGRQVQHHGAQSTGSASHSAQSTYSTLGDKWEIV